MWERFPPAGAIRHAKRAMGAACGVRRPQAIVRCCGPRSSELALEESIVIRARLPGDEAWIAEMLTRWWGSPVIHTRGRRHDGRRLAAWIAMLGDRRTGLCTYRIADGECEIVSLNSLEESRGIGTALLRTAETQAARSGCRRICLITSNDNLAALAFYQKRGYRLSALYPGAIDRTRRVKPEIPEIGLGGIPLRDEIELSRTLVPSSADRKDC
ncbi:MAG: GNAT family N-acetyltransferase [Candidatus Eisenbacteria bacterium]|nr:GNAT family N-acetyltransferase [Candidatus Eisenbacteria bacterium]